MTGRGAGPARSVIRVAPERISDSCGFGVPVYRYESERTQLPAWAERKAGGPGGLDAYRRANNAASIDGLPALRFDGTPPERDPRRAG